MDVHRTAWDVFTRSIDKTELEKERMRVGDLQAERFGSREHHEAMWLHETRRVESRRVMANAHVPFQFAAWQLAVAERVQEKRAA